MSDQASPGNPERERTHGVPIDAVPAWAPVPLEPPVPSPEPSAAAFDVFSDDGLEEALLNLSNQNAPKPTEDLPKPKPGAAVASPNPVSTEEAPPPPGSPPLGPPPAPAQRTSGTGDPRPELRLYNDEFDENECAEQCAALITKAKSAFSHGGVLKELRRNTVTGDSELVEVDPLAFPSRISALARLVVYYRNRHGELYPMPKRMSKNKAEILLKARAMLEGVPPVSILAPCPVATENDGGGFALLGPGYHRECGGLIVTRNIVPTPGIPLEEAVTSLCRLGSGFRWATPQDGWRDMASLLTPALAMGGLIRGRVPIDLSVANEFESGKGYRQQLIAAVYGANLHTIPTAEGGVGHRDESLATAMAKLKYFLQQDNVTDLYKSPFMAALLTADEFSARVPFSASISIDPRRFFVFITSNGAELSPDIASRCNIVRLLKHPAAHTWKKYDEGDVLDHVRARKEYYLGCVFRVIKSWHEAGKPRSGDNRHRFREWGQVLDWILEHLFGAPGFLVGHGEAQQAQSTPGLKFIEAMCGPLCECSHCSEMRIWTAGDMAAMATQLNIEVPGVEPGDPPERIERQIGMHLGRLFPAGFTEAEARVGGYRIRRLSVQKPRLSGPGTFPAKAYTIEAVQGSAPQSTATRSDRSRSA